MPTRFRVFRRIVPESGKIEQEANAFMEEVESRGGKFVESHWSAPGPSSQEPHETFTLVVVYEEAPKLATFRSF